MTRPASPIPVALTIAGSDSGGGAGLQADLKTFARLGVHGASVVTCVTAQNPREVRRIEPCSPRIVRDQLAAVFAELPPAAVKIGLLHSAAIIRTVANFLRSHPGPRVVIDPVMTATSGRGLLQNGAGRELERLLPLACLITPNLDEAGALLDSPIRSVEAMRRAAAALARRFGCAVLVKGGHQRGGSEAADLLRDGDAEHLLTAPYVRGVKTHGTGCTGSAAIAAGLARGLPLLEAVVLGKEFVTQSIRQHRLAGRHPVLWNEWKEPDADQSALRSWRRHC